MLYQLTPQQQQQQYFARGPVVDAVLHSSLLLLARRRPLLLAFAAAHRRLAHPGRASSDLYGLRLREAHGSSVMMDTRKCSKTISWLP